MVLLLLALLLLLLLSLHPLLLSVLLSLMLHPIRTIQQWYASLLLGCTVFLNGVADEPSLARLKEAHGAYEANDSGAHDRTDNRR